VSKHRFKISLDYNNQPVMEFKTKATNQTWQSLGKLYKMNVAVIKKNGKPQLPVGDPLLVPYIFMWGSKDVDITANYMDKKVRRGTDVINNQSFILEGIENS
jgi:hypothetical protein